MTNHYEKLLRIAERAAERLSDREKMLLEENRALREEVSALNAKYRRVECAFKEWVKADSFGDEPSELLDELSAALWAVECDWETIPGDFQRPGKVEK